MVSFTCRHVFLLLLWLTIIGALVEGRHRRRQRRQLEQLLFGIEPTTPPPQQLLLGGSGDEELLQTCIGYLMQSLLRGLQVDGAPFGQSPPPPLFASGQNHQQSSLFRAPSYPSFPSFSTGDLLSSLSQQQRQYFNLRDEPTRDELGAARRRTQRNMDVLNALRSRRTLTTSASASTPLADVADAVSRWFNTGPVKQVYVDTGNNGGLDKYIVNRVDGINALGVPLYDQVKRSGWRFVDAGDGVELVDETSHRVLGQDVAESQANRKYRLPVVNALTSTIQQQLRPILT